MQIDHQCAHDPCDCRVTQEGDYCSDACREQAKGGDSPPAAGCACGHAECAGSNAQASGPTG